MHNVQSARKLPHLPRISNNVEIYRWVVVKNGNFEYRISSSIWSPTCGTIHIKIFVCTHVRSKYTDLRSVKKPHIPLTQVWTTTLKLRHLTCISLLWPTYTTEQSLHPMERYDFFPTDHISILLISREINRPTYFSLEFAWGLEAFFFHFLFALYNFSRQTSAKARLVLYKYTVEVCLHKFKNWNFYDCISTPRHSDHSYLCAWTPIWHLSCTTLHRMHLRRMEWKQPGCRDRVPSKRLKRRPAQGCRHKTGWIDASVMP